MKQDFNKKNKNKKVSQKLVKYDCNKKNKNKNKFSNKSNDY